MNTKTGPPRSQDLTLAERRRLIESVKCPAPSRGGCGAKAGARCSNRAGFPCQARRDKAVEKGLYVP